MAAAATGEQNVLTNEIKRRRSNSDLHALSCGQKNKTSSDAVLSADLAAFFFFLSTRWTLRSIANF